LRNRYQRPPYRNFRESSGPDFLTGATAPHRTWPMLPCGNTEGPVRNLDKLDDG
jgi:hypothetical protein